VSETELEVHRAPGAIKRLTVAVLVNGVRTAGPGGAEIFEPMPQDELDALEELIASAVGYDAARGDVITLKSLNLPSIEPQGTLAAASMWQSIHLDAMALIQMAVLALVSLTLGMFVIRPILTNAATVPALLPAGADVEAPYLEGEIATDGGQEVTPLPDKV
jgi:flagellar M-ring protein FliF